MNDQYSIHLVCFTSTHLLLLGIQNKLGLSWTCLEISQIIKIVEGYVFTDR